MTDSLVADGALQKMGVLARDGGRIEAGLMEKNPCIRLMMRESRITPDNLRRPAMPAGVRFMVGCSCTRRHGRFSLKSSCRTFSRGLGASWKIVGQHEFIIWN
jgi:hypothetical protein